MDRTGYLIHRDEVVPGVLRWLEGPAGDPNCREALAEAGEVVFEHLFVGSKEKLGDQTFQALGVRVVLVEELRSAAVVAIALSVLSL